MKFTKYLFFLLLFFLASLWVEEAEGQASPERKLKKSRKDKKPKRRKKRLRGEFLFSFNGIYDSLHRRRKNSTGSSDSVLVSHLQPQLVLAWQLYWKKRWYGIFDAELISRNYEAGKSNNQNILDRKFRQGSVYAGVGYKWGQWSFANAYLGLDECFYYRQADEEFYVLEDHRVPAIKLKLSQKIVRFGRFPVSIMGDFQYLNKSGTSFEGGMRYGGGLEIKYLMRSSSFGSGFFFQQGVFDSVWSTFDYKAVGASFSYSRKF